VILKLMPRLTLLRQFDTCRLIAWGEYLHSDSVGLAKY